MSVLICGPGPVEIFVVQNVDNFLLIVEHVRLRCLCFLIRLNPTFSVGTFDCSVIPVGFMLSKKSSENP